MARGRHVGASAVTHDRVGDVLRKSHQRALGGRIPHQKRNTAIRRHAAKVDDQARVPLAPHDLDRFLNQEKGHTHVDCHDPIP